MADGRRWAVEVVPHVRTRSKVILISGEGHLAQATAHKELIQRKVLVHQGGV